MQIVTGLASGVVTGSLLNDIWSEVTGNTGYLTSLVLNLLANNTSGLLSTVLGTIAGGANYTYMTGTSATTSTTDVLYPVVAGGIGVRYEVNGSGAWDGAAAAHPDPGPGGCLGDCHRRRPL